MKRNVPNGYRPGGNYGPGGYGYPGMGLGYGMRPPMPGGPAPMGKGRYAKKNKGVILVVTLLSLVFVILAIIEFTGAFTIGIYKDGETTITMIDPVMGLIKNIAKNDMESNFYMYYENAADAYALIPVYAVSCTIVLYLVCICLIFFKSLAALGGGRSRGGFKKIGFGYLSFAALLCALNVFISGMYISGGSIMSVADFVKPESVFSAGYFLYVMIALPIVFMILSGCAYKKAPTRMPY